MIDREETLEASKENPEVDWDADNEGVLSFRVEYETDDQSFWLQDVVEVRFVDNGLLSYVAREEVGR